MRGAAISTLLRNESYTFQSLGTHIERADMTTRVVGVRAASLMKPAPREGREYDEVQWMSVLRSLSAHQMFQRSTRASITGTGVVRFLPVWDAWLLVRELDPRWLGIRYDVRHAVAEGSASWELGLQLLAPHIRSLDFKDFVWQADEHGDWGVESVPLGTALDTFVDLAEDPQPHAIALQALHVPDIMPSFLEQNPMPLIDSATSARPVPSAGREPPGQKPAIPHPMPKIVAPATRRPSMSRFVGRWKRALSQGRSRASTRR